VTSAARVLVVDDEVGMRETVADILTGVGYQVTTAVDGDDALTRLRSTTFSLVLMDIRMPGRDGISILREMGGPPPPVVLMTAYADGEQLRAAAEAGSLGVLHKPVPAARLIDVVTRAVTPR
jgi:CheY-like chemotaxis protein